MFRHPVSIICFISLAACGGSSSSFTTDPIAAAGFATASSQVQGGESFEVQEVSRILGSTDGELSFATQPITYVISDDGSAVTITIDGTTYTLPFAPSNGRYLFEDPDGSLAARLLGDRVPEVEIVDITAIRDGTLNDGKIAIGFDTNPATVAAQTGNATFGGQIFVTIRNGFEDGAGEGLVTLQVDFDANTIGGNFNVIDSGDIDSELTIPSSTFTLHCAAVTSPARLKTRPTPGGFLAMRRSPLAVKSLPP